VAIILGQSKLSFGRYVQFPMLQIALI
jgi:hypothetical protein